MEEGRRAADARGRRRQGRAWQPNQLSFLPSMGAPAALSRVTDSSGEGFAVRLYKAARPAGVVRAFSDAPSSFAAEFAKVSW